MQAVLGIILPAKDCDRKSMMNAIQIKYDPARVTYKKLLDVFWRHIDPTDAGGQFTDRDP